jgi:GNAT superfamily N-acetyltransferase/SAM-dependent methyltransferase
MEDTNIKLVVVNCNEYDQHIRELFRISYQDSIQSNFVACTLDSTLLRPFDYFNKNNGKLLLLESDGQLIAMLGITCTLTEADVQYLAVHPSHRRNGHGSFLLSYAINNYPFLKLSCFATDRTTIAFCSSHSKLEHYETYPKIVFGRVFPVMLFKNVIGSIIANSHMVTWLPSFSISSESHTPLDQTETNKTITDRTLQDYASAFNINIATELQRLYKAKSKELVILDSGCGKGIAMQQLLAMPNLAAYVSMVYGISKDYFREIETVIRQNPAKFKYYPLTLDAAVQTQRFAVDLIFDLWGVFAYSFEKVKVLQQYYDMLTPGGTAYIYIGPVFHLNGERCVDPRIKIITDKAQQPQRYELLFEALIKRFPEQFSSTNFNNILIVTKTSDKFPLVGNFDYSFSNYGTTFTQQKTLAAAYNGNAINYCNLTISCRMA